MCGIFGIVGQNYNNAADIRRLSSHAKRRGQDSSGIMMYQDETYFVEKADFDISKLVSNVKIKHQVCFLV